MVTKNITVAMRVLSLATLLITTSALAEVVATIDRTSVELNESFTLKVIVDSQLDVEPNIDALSEDFMVGVQPRVSNTTIINGDVQRTMNYSYVLMAKRAGKLQIPALRVGSERSKSIPITVTPQSTAVPGEADIFITTEVDSTNSFVQAQILYTVKTYRSVATRQPRWTEPRASGVDTLLEIAGEEKNYESLLDGKAYNVIERVYAFFPQESGEFTITPAEFHARVLRNGRITGRKIFRSAAITVTVNPIPPPPAEFPDAAWFPARNVELSQDWSRELRGVQAGEPITRHVTTIAAGQLQTQIPQLQPSNVQGVRVYPDKPEERSVVGPQGIHALRRDQYALIGTQAGAIELPEVTLPWWDIDAGEWRIARLPTTMLEIVPSLDVAVAQTVEQPSLNSDGRVEPVVQKMHSELWRTVSIALFSLWLLTLVFWWWSRRPAVYKSKEAKEPPLHKQQARYLKQARKAALANDAVGVKDALLGWSRLQWPTNAPRSIGDLAKRVSMPLSLELDNLCNASYGPGESDWSGEKLAVAIRSFSVLNDQRDTSENRDLPPLFPSSA